MRVTRWPLILGNALGVVLVLALAGCADDLRSSEAASQRETELPAAVEDVLARDNIKLIETSFDNGVSSAEVMDAFTREYGGIPEQEIQIYAAEVVASDESRLEPGTLVRMVHVAEVLREVTPPSPEPNRETVSPLIIELDMFAFFSAENATHLATVYIGPQAA
jgi:hypothetical protein